MDADDLRRIALSLEGAEESSHMGKARLPGGRHKDLNGHLQSLIGQPPISSACSALDLPNFGDHPIDCINH